MSAGEAPLTRLSVELDVAGEVIDSLAAYRKEARGGDDSDDGLRRDQSPLAM